MLARREWRKVLLLVTGGAIDQGFLISYAETKDGP